MLVEQNVHVVLILLGYLPTKHHTHVGLANTHIVHAMHVGKEIMSPEYDLAEFRKLFEASGFKVEPMPMGFRVVLDFGKIYFEVYDDELTIDVVQFGNPLHNI